MNKHLLRYLLAASLLAGASGAAWAIKANPKPVAVDALNAVSAVCEPGASPTQRHQNTLGVCLRLHFKTPVFTITTNHALFSAKVV